MLASIIFAVTGLFSAAFLIISWRVRKTAGLSFSMYAIGGGALPLYLVLFADLATAMGAGNFVGHATSAFKAGISHIPFIVGEQGAKIVFALAFAGWAGRFSYSTISDLIYDLVHRDPLSKMVVGLLTGSIMIAWLAGQTKGLGYIFQQFTGLDPLPVIIAFNIVFVIYTYLGGIVSVVWTELIQGVMVVIFGGIFYYFAFSPVHWSLNELAVQATAAAGPSYWSLDGVPLWRAVESFLVGCFGVLAAQVYWQRCFASKDAATARNAMLISGVVVLVMTTATAFVGMTARALNPDLDPSLAMPWLMMNYTPMWVVVLVYTLVLAAAMSSASALLNSAAIIFVTDILQPIRPAVTDHSMVVWAKRSTIVIGAVATFLAITADSIIGLFARAYTIAGSAVVPILLVGILWKERPAPFVMGVRNSRVTAWGARLAIATGAFASLKFGIFAGIGVTTAVVVFVSMVERRLRSAGRAIGGAE